MYDGAAVTSKMIYLASWSLTILPQKFGDIKKNII